MERSRFHRVYSGFCMLFLLSVLALFGCKHDEKVPEKQEKVPDVQYETGKVTAFCVDIQGKIYSCEEGAETIRVYDTEGTKLKEIAVDGGTGAGTRYTVLCAGEGVLYASDSVDMGIVAIDVLTGAKELLYPTPTPGFWNLFDMVFCNGNLYVMYQTPLEYADMQLLTDHEAGYEYLGETVVFIHPETKEVTELDVVGAKRICKKNENEILFFSYEPEKGFLYREYDTKKKSFSAEYAAKQGLELRWAVVMTYDETMERLLYPGFFDGKLRAIDITREESETDFYNTGLSHFGVNSLQCVNGWTYFVVDGKVKRIDNGSYLTVTENEPLKILRVSPRFAPAGGLGHEVVIENADSETITTKLLAGDSDFDLLFLTSESNIGEQIRRVGAFEPLNGVEGVETYLNGCFDYIKEAATAENGGIWMLPYEISTRVLVYQPELCKKYGIDFSGDLTYPEYIAYRELMNDNDSEDRSYFQSMLVWWTPLYQYIMNYGLVNGEANFDTDRFRALALDFKNLATIYNDTIKRTKFENAATHEELRDKVQKYFENYAFGDLEKDELERQVGLISDAIGTFTAILLDYDFFEARKMPSISKGGEEKSVAYACFYVINPNSKRKKEAMEYLSAITEELNQNESIYRTRELKGEYSKMQKQVHEVYADAEIYFQYPSDVFGSEYVRYVRENMELDELIQEMERKFTIYLKE